MATLVVGASGATGKQLVEQLLLMGQHVKPIVRPSANIPNSWNNHEKITIIKANLSGMTLEEKAIKFVLMNTVGYRNRDLNEPISLGQKIVISIIRALVPPHSDNEAAAEFLRLNIGQKNAKIQWVVVRPDTLINQNSTTDYNLHVSPTTTLFKPGKTSRINVGNFMARLISEDGLWEEWKGKMPVIYNA